MSEELVDARQPNSEIKRGRTKARLNVFCAVGLAFATLLVANYCASLLYAHWQFDINSNGGLSPRTLEFLQSSQGEIKITSLFEKNHPFRKATKSLLNEYVEAAALIPGLDIKVTSLAVNHDIAETATLMRRLPVEANSIVFEYGQLYRIISEYDMVSADADHHWSDDERPGKRQHLFNGERACTAALLKLLQPTAAVIYFVEGHGEYDPDSSHQITGASIASQALTLNEIAVRKLNLQQIDAVPQDCNVLVVAGPRTMYSQREIESISSYLLKGGKAMILIDDTYAGGLTPILNKWGVRVTTPELLDLRSAHVSTTLYGEHAITSRLKNIMTIFANPCKIDTTPSDPLGSERADKPKISRLILLPSKNSANDNDGLERALPIAAASEIGGTTLTGRRHNTRLVICGDSDFISNEMNPKGFAGNTIFFLSAIEWLLGRQGRPAADVDVSSILHSGIDPEVGWLNLSATLAVAVPAIILFFGLLIYIPITRRL